MISDPVLLGGYESSPVSCPVNAVAQAFDSVGDLT